MCGIAGCFDSRNSAPPDAGGLKAMADAIAHRGPDGEGFFLGQGVGLAHRRLAVIDLVTGAQPMRNVDGDVVIVFNGEIYNFAVLKAELARLGHRFQTRSDTEVILAAWKEWGEDCVARLEGMFAFALWDDSRQVLFLARDRMGEKPLYYAFLPDGRFIFASELAALLTCPDLDRTIDPCAVEEFFALGYVVEPRSIYRAVRKLPAAHRLLIGRQAPVKIEAYWNVRAAPSLPRADADFAEELEQRLSDSVASQMVSDVPIGAFLSGGIDSGVTAAMMARQSGDALNCFTIGFSDPRFDESVLAAQVARRYGVRHHREVLHGDEADLAAGLAQVYGEPFGDSSAIPTLRLMRLARAQVTVALSGDGGDELFAGYRRYGFHAREEAIRGLLPRVLRRPLFGALGRLYPQLDWAPRWLRARQTFLELSRDTVEGYVANLTVTPESERRRLFSSGLRRGLQGYRACDAIAPHFAAAPFEDAVAKAQYVDVKTWLPGDILTKVDRAAMAHSLEVRVPMLNADLVQWALNLPREQKLAEGQSKRLLRQLAARRLPMASMSRPKQGFSVPLAAWFRGAMGAAFERDLAAGQGIAAAGLFDMPYIQALLQRHRQGLRDHSRTLFLCWMFDKFLREVHEAPARRSERDAVALSAAE